MEPSPNDLTLTPERIYGALDNTQRGDPPSPEYSRLLEIYCVVKAGGVAIQQSVVTRLEQQEQATLTAEIQALEGQGGNGSQIESLKQEIQELQQAMADRRAYLATVPPEEEAAVRDCLAAIEAYFQGDR